MSNDVDSRVKYAVFKQQHDRWCAKEKDKSLRRGNRAYNRGLFKGLRLRGLILYPLLKRHHI